MDANEETAMAKRIDASVKIDPAVLEECRLASAFAGMNLGEYVSARMLDAARKDIAEGIAKRNQDTPAPKGKKSR